MAKRWFILPSILLLIGVAPSLGEEARLISVKGRSVGPTIRMVSAVHASDPALRLGYRLGGRVDQELPTNNQRQLRIFVDQDPQDSENEPGVFLSPDLGSLREPEFTMSFGITW
jgi:hypothetical protein